MSTHQLKLIPDLTERAFGVAGSTAKDTDLHEKFKAMGGKFNSKYRCWVFSKQNRLKQVCEAFGLTDCESEPQASAKAPKKSELLKMDAVSAQHLAMQFFVAGGGVNPECVSRFNGTFGKDRQGKVFGATERATMAWMLDSKQLPIDQLAIDLAQDSMFLPEHIEAALLECVNDYADGEKNRATGRARMIKDMVDLASFDGLPF